MNNLWHKMYPKSLAWSLNDRLQNLWLSGYGKDNISDLIITLSRCHTILLLCSYEKCKPFYSILSASTNPSFKPFIRCINCPILISNNLTFWVFYAGWTLYLKIVTFSFYISMLMLSFRLLKYKITICFILTVLYNCDISAQFYFIIFSSMLCSLFTKLYTTVSL